MKTTTLGNITFGIGLGYLVILLGLVIGWFMNIIEIVATFSGPITGMLIARLVGVLAFPLGGILGYF